MISPDLVPSDPELPRKTAVAVIGGGIVGISTALELAERGIDVTVIEKGIMAGEQSGRNWGWCRQMGRDSREAPLILESLNAWRGMNARVGAETGFNQCGIIYLCETEAELAVRRKWQDEVARPNGIASRLVGGEEADKLQPGAARKWVGALYTESDGRAEPIMAAPAIATGARQKGAKILTHCAVRGLETSAGRVSAIVTERGTVA